MDRINDIPAFLIVFALAFSISLALTPLARYLGLRFNIVATPGGRRKHYGKVSTLGGIAIFGGFIVAALATQILPVPRFDPYEVFRFAGLILGGLVIFIVGLVDDIFELNPLQLGIGQILAAAIAVGFQIFIETINNPLTGQQSEPWPFFVTVTVSMFWLGVMMNTVNFMDGLDGLAAGVAVITGAMLFVHSAFVLEPAQTSVSLLPLALIGASLGFLLYNFHPATVFMGGGAQLLGFLIGSLSIIGGAKMATILLVMGLPLMDFTWQIFNRLRKGRNPMQGDRGHIHFRLQDLGYGQQRIVLTYYLFCSFFGILTLITASRTFKFIALSVMVALLVAGFALLSRSDQGRSSSGTSSPTSST